MQPSGGTEAEWEVWLRGKHFCDHCGELMPETELCRRPFCVSRRLAATTKSVDGTVPPPDTAASSTSIAAVAAESPSTTAAPTRSGLNADGTTTATAIAAAAAVPITPEGSLGFQCCTHCGDLLNEADGACLNSHCSSNILKVVSTMPQTGATQPGEDIPAAPAVDGTAVVSEVALELQCCTHCGDLLNDDDGACLNSHCSSKVQTQPKEPSNCGGRGETTATVIPAPAAAVTLTPEGSLMGLRCCTQCGDFLNETDGSCVNVNCASWMDMKQRSGSNDYNITSNNHALRGTTSTDSLDSMGTRRRVASKLRPNFSLFAPPSISTGNSSVGTYSVVAPPLPTSLTAGAVPVAASITPPATTAVVINEAATANVAQDTDSPTATYLGGKTTNASAVVDDLATQLLHGRQCCNECGDFLDDDDDCENPHCGSHLEAISRVAQGLPAKARYLSVLNDDRAPTSTITDSSSGAPPVSRLVMKPVVRKTVTISDAAATTVPPMESAAASAEVPPSKGTKTVRISDVVTTTTLPSPPSTTSSTPISVQGELAASGTSTSDASGLKVTTTLHPMMTTTRTTTMNPNLSFKRVMFKTAGLAGRYQEADFLPFGGLPSVSNSSRTGTATTSPPPSVSSASDLDGRFTAESFRRSSLETISSSLGSIKDLKAELQRFPTQPAVTTLKLTDAAATTTATTIGGGLGGSASKHGSMVYDDNDNDALVMVRIGSSDSYSGAGSGGMNPPRMSLTYSSGPDSSSAGEQGGASGARHGGGGGGKMQQYGGGGGVGSSSSMGFPSSGEEHLLGPIISSGYKSGPASEYNFSRSQSVAASAFGHSMGPFESTSMMTSAIHSRSQSRGGDLVGGDFDEEEDVEGGGGKGGGGGGGGDPKGRSPSPSTGMGTPQSSASQAWYPPPGMKRPLLRPEAMGRWANSEFMTPASTMEWGPTPVNTSTGGGGATTATSSSNAPAGSQLHRQGVFQTPPSGPVDGFFSKPSNTPASGPNAYFPAVNSSNLLSTVVPPRSALRVPLVAPVPLPLPPPWAQPTNTSISVAGASTPMVSAEELERRRRWEEVQQRMALYRRCRFGGIHAPLVFRVPSETCPASMTAELDSGKTTTKVAAVDMKATMPPPAPAATVTVTSGKIHPRDTTKGQQPQQPSKQQHDSDDNDGDDSDATAVRDAEGDVSSGGEQGGGLSGGGRLGKGGESKAGAGSNSAALSSGSTQKKRRRRRRRRKGGADSPVQQQDGDQGKQQQQQQQQEPRWMVIESLAEHIAEGKVAEKDVPELWKYHVAKFPPPPPPPYLVGLPSEGGSKIYDRAWQRWWRWYQATEEWCQEALPSSNESSVATHVASSVSPAPKGNVTKGKHEAPRASSPSRGVGPQRTKGSAPPLPAALPPLLTESALLWELGRVVAPPPRPPLFIPGTNVLMTGGAYSGGIQDWQQRCGRWWSTVHFRFHQLLQHSNSGSSKGAANAATQTGNTPSPRALPPALDVAFIRRYVASTITPQQGSSEVIPEATLPVNVLRAEVDHDQQERID